MRSVEITAKTLEEARKAAAFQLGVDEAAMEVEILGEPHRILGVLGSGQYRIRATYVERVAEPPAELEPEPESTLAEPEPESTLAEPEPEPTLAEPEPTRTLAEPEPEPTLAELEPEPTPVELAPEPTPVELAPAVMPPEPVTEQPPDSRRVVAERAQQITEDILGLMGIPKPVTITAVGEEQVELEVTDDEESSGLLIGRHGATLDALQLLVAMAANAGIEDGCRVVLDIHGYRKRHEEKLSRMAYSHAQQVKETGQEMVIPDLKAYERRLIHMALREDPDVSTYSEGEGRSRRMVISPASPPAQSED